MTSQHRYRFTIESVASGLLIFAAAFIIGIIAIAWQAMSRNGNESNAVSIISSLRTKQNEYAAEHSGKFASSFAAFGEFKTKMVGDKVVSDGYIFTIEFKESDNTKPAFYSITADAQIYYWIFPAGAWHLYFDSRLQTIKFTEENRQATADDSSL